MSAGTAPRIDAETQDKKCLVYALVDSSCSDIRYVGMSSNGLYRPRQHMSAYRFNGPLKHTHLYRWVRKMVSENKSIDINVLEYCSKEFLAEREIYWIKKLREEGKNLCNATNGGEGTPGRIMSESAKKTIRNRYLGKTLSPEHRQKLSLAHIGLSSGKKGKKLTPEQKLRISQNSARLSGNKNPFFGKRHTDDTRRKISESLKGKKRSVVRIMSQETKNKISMTLKNRVKNHTVGGFKVNDSEGDTQ